MCSFKMLQNTKYNNKKIYNIQDVGRRFPRVKKKKSTAGTTELLL